MRHTHAYTSDRYLSLPILCWTAPFRDPRVSCSFWVGFSWNKLLDDTICLVLEATSGSNRGEKTGRRVEFCGWHSTWIRCGQDIQEANGNLGTCIRYPQLFSLVSDFGGLRGSEGHWVWSKGCWCIRFLSMAFNKLQKLTSISTVHLKRYNQYQ